MIRTNLQEEQYRPVFGTFIERPSQTAFVRAAVQQKGVSPHE